MYLADLRAFLRQTEDALALHPLGPDHAPRWVQHQYIGRSSRCKVLRHVLLRCRILCLIPWCRSVVRHTR